MRVEELDSRLVVLINQVNQLGWVRGTTKKGSAYHIPVQSYTQKYSEQLEALRMEAILLKKQHDDDDEIDSFDRSHELSLRELEQQQELSESKIKPSKTNRSIQNKTPSSAKNQITAKTDPNTNINLQNTSNAALSKQLDQSQLTQNQLTQNQQSIKQAIHAQSNAQVNTFTDIHYQVFQKPKTATTAMESYLSSSRVPTKIAPMTIESEDEDEDLIDISIESHSSSFNELSEEEINRIKAKGFDELQATQFAEDEHRATVDYPWAEEIIDELSSLLPPPYKGYENIAPVYGLGGRFFKVTDKKPWQLLDEVDWRYFDLSQFHDMLTESLSHPPADLQERVYAYAKPVTLKLEPSIPQHTAYQQITEDLSLEDLNQAYQVLEQQIPTGQHNPSLIPQQQQAFDTAFPIAQDDQQFEEFINEFQFDPHAFDAQIEDVIVADPIFPVQSVQDQYANMSQDQYVVDQQASAPPYFSAIATEIVLTGESTAITPNTNAMMEEYQGNELPRSFDMDANMPTLLPNHDQASTVDQITTDEFQSIKSQISMTTDEFTALQPTHTLNALPEKKKKGFLARLFGGQKD